MKKLINSYILCLNFIIGISYHGLTQFRESEQKAIQLAGLTRLWSEIKFNYVNIDKTEYDLDSLLEAYTKKVLLADDTVNYYRILSHFIALFNDAHTYVVPPVSIRNNYYASPPIEIVYLEEKAIIHEIHDSSIYEIDLIGMSISKINGFPIEAYASDYIAPYISGSTEHGKKSKMYIREILRGEIGKDLDLELTSYEGHSRKLTVQRVNEKLRNSINNNLELNIVDDSISVLTCKSFNEKSFWKDFDSLYSEILKTKALIIDIRNNHGGNSNQGYYILRHITNHPFKTTAWKMRENMAMFNSQGVMNFWQLKEPDILEPMSDREIYFGDVVVLINSRTISAAEDFAVTFDQMDRGTILGMSSAGSSGKMTKLLLPYGGYARVCIRRDSYADGKEYNGIGVIPDIVVDRIWTDYLKGIDSQLEYALRYIRTKD